MPRFPAKKVSVSEDRETLRAEISASDYAHITKVMRLGAGDRINVFDAGSVEYEGTIKDISSEAVMVRIHKTRALLADPELELNLFQAILKGNKMDGIISQAVQLGVSEIFPVISERTQVRSTAKVSRWNKIAMESTKQCGRAKPPVVREPVYFGDSLGMKEETELKVILHENQGEYLETHMGSISAPVNSVNVHIGPEGGFSEKEIALAKKNEYVTLWLGKRILRAETASVVSLALIQSHIGDI